MRSSTTAVVARNVLWSGAVCSEPYEAGWAENAVIFVRALKQGTGTPGRAHVEISPDGLHWVREGNSFALPLGQNEVTSARVSNFGNWLRLSCEFLEGSSVVVLLTIHLKS